MRRAQHIYRRSGVWIAVAGVVAIGALGVPARAPGSSVTVRLDREFHNNEVYYAADLGERNNVVVAYAADATTVTVTDPGALVRPTGSCSRIDDHSAICRAPTPRFPIAGQFVQHARVELGDLDDRVVTTRPGPYPIGGVDADGGPGADELLGSPVEDALDGGGGRDVLRGGGGFDTLSDGDRDGAADGEAPGADVLDGGPGLDELSYRQREEAVIVDLADRGPDGARGEGDALTGIEWVRGGKGDDELLGDRSGNVLDGAGGLNRLVGRGGDDLLRHPSARSASCGAGRDLVATPRVTASIPVSCERLLFRLPRGTISDDEFFSLAPHPERRLGQLGFEIECPEIDGEPLRCSATIRILERATHRLIAEGSASPGGRGNRFLRLTLTPVGQRLLQTHGRVLAITAVRGRLPPKARWTTRF